MLDHPLHTHRCLNGDFLRGELMINTNYNIAKAKAESIVEDALRLNIIADFFYDNGTNDPHIIPKEWTIIYPNGKAIHFSSFLAAINHLSCIVNNTVFLETP